MPKLTNLVLTHLMGEGENQGTFRYLGANDLLGGTSTDFKCKTF